MTLDTAAPFHVRTDRRSPAGAWLVFALLVFGWLCANRPQPLVFALTDWAKNAASFSHQQRLADDVRALLAAQTNNADIAVSMIATTSDDHAATTPFASPNCVHSRQDWSLAETLLFAPPEFTSTERFSLVAHRVPLSPADDVPHPPPRAVVSA